MSKKEKVRSGIRGGRRNIVFYVTAQYMKKNRKRTVTTFAGIVLMVLLMTCVFVGRDTGIQYLEEMAAQKSGRYHAAAYGVSQEGYEKLRALPYVRQTAGSVSFGCTEFPASNDPEHPYLNVKGYTKECYDWMNISLVEGRLPETDTELVISESAWEDGSTASVGDTVEAVFFTRSVTGTAADGGKTYFPFFGLSVADGETIAVPENFPYYEENDSFRENRSYTREKQSYQIVGIMEAPLYESAGAAGYTALTTLTMDQVLARGTFHMTMLFDQRKLPDFWLADLEDLLPGCEIEINDQVLAFSADSSDTTINLVVSGMTVLFTALIMLVAVVLIYNVFHMSFRERSRYLGMLCSVGATGRQKRSSIYYEAFVLLLPGLPLGVLLGTAAVWVAMTVFRPLIASFMNIGYGAGTIGVQVQISPGNLAAVSCLSIVTVLVSAYLPARKIGRIGPIESIRDNTQRRSRTYRTSRQAIAVGGAQGMLAWNTLFRKNRRMKSVARAASVFLILLTVTAFGAKGIHRVMEKKLISEEISNNPKNSDYLLFSEGDGPAYDALKAEIADDPAVEEMQEWRSAMFLGSVDASVYSEEYWEAVYQIFCAYHQGALSREEFERDWKYGTPPVNVLSVDENTFRSMAEACGADVTTLGEDSVLLMNEGEFSTDNVSVAGMRPDRYRYYHVNPMTGLAVGEELCVCFTSGKTGEETKQTFTVAGLAVMDQLREYLSGTGGYYFWMITGPEGGKKLAELTDDPEGNSSMAPFLTLRMKDPDAELLGRLSQLSDMDNTTFHLVKSDYVQSMERAIVLLADILLSSFVAIASVICFLNLINSVRSWIQESSREYLVLRSVGMTGRQMKQMVLLQCVGIFARAVLLAAAVSGVLIALIFVGIRTVFGNLVLFWPFLLTILSVLAVGIVLALLSVWSLDREMKEAQHGGQKAGCSLMGE